MAKIVSIAALFLIGWFVIRDMQVMPGGIADRIMKQEISPGRQLVEPMSQPVAEPFVQHIEISESQPPAAVSPVAIRQTVNGSWLNMDGAYKSAPITGDVQDGRPAVAGWDRVAETGFKHYIQKVEFNESLRQPLLLNVDSAGVKWVFGPGGWFECQRLIRVVNDFDYNSPDDNAVEYWRAQRPSTRQNMYLRCNGG